MTPKTSMAAANHLRVGEYHKAFAGVLAGLMRGEPGKPDYYLFVAQHVAAESKKIKFGGYGTDVKGSSSDLDGAANTDALIASGIEHPAARFCRNLTIDGASDFYLPARHELRLCYLNVPDLFDKSAWYWSSTQYTGSLSDAWYQGFGNGYQGNVNMGYEGRCRAVRSILVI